MINCSVLFAYYFHRFVMFCANWSVRVQDKTSSSYNTLGHYQLIRLDSYYHEYGQLICVSGVKGLMLVEAGQFTSYELGNPTIYHCFTGVK